MSISRFTYSRILSIIRGADYAHPGEVDGIERVLQHVNSGETQTILDVGCGLGGTASYIAAAGYGRVTGIDPDKHSISHASKHYPDVEFYAIEATEAGRLARRFDVIIVMNVAYLIADKGSLLRALAVAAHTGTQLVISDFCDYHGSGESVSIDGRATIPHPIQPAKLEDYLRITGWRLKTIENLSPAYAYWYAVFVERIVHQKADILECAGEDGYRFVLEKYSRIRDAIVTNQLGGGIISAIYTGGQHRK